MLGAHKPLQATAKGAPRLSGKTFGSLGFAKRVRSKGIVSAECSMSEFDVAKSYVAHLKLWLAISRYQPHGMAAWNSGVLNGCCAAHKDSIAKIG